MKKNIEILIKHKIEGALLDPKKEHHYDCVNTKMANIWLAKLAKSILSINQKTNGGVISDVVPLPTKDEDSNLASQYIKVELFQEEGGLTIDDNIINYVINMILQIDSVESAEVMKNN